MKDFETWFLELCSNYVWFQPASMQHKPETFKKLAHNVYMQCVAEGQFKPIQECRKHVYHLVCKTPGDRQKVDWVKKALEKVEAEKKVEAPPLTGEARMQRLKEWEEVVKKSEMVSAVPKMTAKQIIEEGDWRAVEPIKPRSEIEKRIVLEEHIERINTARRKMFLAAFPDASEEEITSYLNQFKTI